MPDSMDHLRSCICFPDLFKYILLFFQSVSFSTQLNQTDHQEDFHRKADRAYNAVDEGREGECDDQIIGGGAEIDDAKSEQQRYDTIEMMDAGG